MFMRVRHADQKLERLETEVDYFAGFGREVVRGYRKVMAWIRDARDERDFYALKSLHFEKLKGKRSHQRSMRLNQQFRLVLQIEQIPGGNTAVILAIEDYH
jgi:proteic killer suppression protein